MLFNLDYPAGALKTTLKEIKIRNELHPGDLGYIIHLHGELYNTEYNYGISFESYVAEGLAEFYKNYDAERDRIWICEHNSKIIGTLLIMHRSEQEAQLRYFLIVPEYRGIGLGNRLIQSALDFLKAAGYKSCYLWTTDELHAAASLYRKFGFKLTEEFTSDAFGKRVTEQRYDLSL